MANDSFQDRKSVVPEDQLFVQCIFIETALGGELECKLQCFFRLLCCLSSWTVVCIQIGNKHREEILWWTTYPYIYMPSWTNRESPSGILVVDTWGVPKCRNVCHLMESEWEKPEHDCPFGHAWMHGHLENDPSRQQLECLYEIQYEPSPCTSGQSGFFQLVHLKKVGYLAAQSGNPTQMAGPCIRSCRSHEWLVHWGTRVSVELGSHFGCAATNTGRSGWVSWGVQLGLCKSGLAYLSRFFGCTHHSNPWVAVWMELAEGGSFILSQQYLQNCPHTLKVQWWTTTHRRESGKSGVPQFCRNM